MKTNAFRAICVACLATLMVPISSSAQGVNDKTYTGTFCRRWDGGTGSAWYSDNTVYNTSTANSMKLACPIVRDETSTPPEGPIVFSVVDQSSTGSVCCSLRMRQFNGQVNYVGPNTCTNAASFGSLEVAKTLDLGPVPTAEAWNTARVWLWCDVPASMGTGRESGVAAYWVNE